jgi:hypothetical protein
MPAVDPVIQQPFIAEALVARVRVVLNSKTREQVPTISTPASNVILSPHKIENQIGKSSSVTPRFPLWHVAKRKKITLLAAESKRTSHNHWFTSAAASSKHLVKCDR